MVPFTDTPSWHALLAHRDALAPTPLDALWRADPDRGASFTFQCAGIAADFSKQRADAETLRLLVALARERDVPAAIATLFAGEKVNVTEGRPALHMALRGDEHTKVGGHDIHVEVQRNRERMRVFADAVRNGQWKSATGATFTHVLALGIGGSSLGPRLVIEALHGEADGPEVRFIENIDPAEFDDATHGLDPATTLVVVASKTFTTQETKMNAMAAREWVSGRLGEGALPKHFVAATANVAGAAEFGLPECNVFPFEDWVGGRYSLWSSVGLPIAIAVGSARFEQMLAGAHATDLHFRSDPLERNVPALHGLFGVWNRNALGMATHAVLSYASRMEHLPQYLQQLEMESNGKRVDREGREVLFPTCPVVWGGTETPSQHAFHQWLHQGTDLASADFIVVAQPMDSRLVHHEILLANALAQSEALMTGNDPGDPARVSTGNRVSTTLVLPKLDAYHLGALLAIYEHSVFVEASVWGINPFDQFGVELGKTIANRILPAVQGANVPLHPATSHLLGVIRKLSETH